MIERTLHGGSARLLYGAPNLETLKLLPDESVHCCVTSPPYFNLRDYCGHEEQIGKEDTPEAFVASMVRVFSEVRRVLHPSGTLWLNLGDSYNGSGGAGGDYGPGGIKEGQPKFKGARVRGLKPKDLIGIPWRVALALQADGWWLRQDIIWHKPAPMPESVRDRCTKAHEYIFLLTKSAKYAYDAAAIAEPSVTGERYHGGYAAVMADGTTNDRNGRHSPGNATLTRNKRSVWTIKPQSYSGAHFAVFPEELPRLCIAAGCPQDGTVLDPFSGSGTTGKVALSIGRKYIGLDLNEDYLDLALRRVDQYRADEPTNEEQEGQASLFSGVD